MAAKSQWLLQIPYIIEQLSALDAPVVDRAVCERLFGVKRRRAITLMQQFGGYQAGNTILIDRLALMAHLQRKLNEPQIEEEKQRKQRLSEHLAKLEKHRRAAAVRIPVGPEAVNCTVADLSPGVRFESGKLIVKYQGVEELLARLFELAKSAANDFDSFAEAAQALPATAPDRGGLQPLSSAPPG